MAPKNELASLSNRYLTPEEIQGWKPHAPARTASESLDQVRASLEKSGQWNPGQVLGRRWAVGCVALEITQRCNLDCSACYLSEHSEAVKDLPLEEIYRRIDMIFDHYGPNTDVQVTGGDPTLRRRDELVAIVRRIRQKGMRPALFTNGIRAKRELLHALCDAGLVDVAFHVDLTQRRRGFRTERELNKLRQEYLDRARGLPLCVVFNTTVFPGNFDQIEVITRFFVKNALSIRLASFQLEARTGRGSCSSRDPRISLQSVADRIENGANAKLSFSTAQIGHSRCNRLAVSLIANGNVYDVLADKTLYAGVLENSAHLPLDRQKPGRVAGTLARAILSSPKLSLRAGWRAAQALWRAKTDLVSSRARVGKVSFFIHDFMDADCLERERLEGCAFMVATKDGPISMCLHNAKRDSFILDDINVRVPGGIARWSPLTGTTTEAPSKNGARTLLDLRLVQQPRKQ